MKKYNCFNNDESWYKSSMKSSLSTFLAWTQMNIISACYIWNHLCCNSLGCTQLYRPYLSSIWRQNEQHRLILLNLACVTKETLKIGMGPMVYWTSGCSFPSHAFNFNRGFLLSLGADPQLQRSPIALFSKKSPPSNGHKTKCSQVSCGSCMSTCDDITEKQFLTTPHPIQLTNSFILHILLSFMKLIIIDI